MALASAVVGVVEAFALEVDRRRVQHALDSHPCIGVGDERIFAKGLLHLKGAPVRASVFVDGHCRPDYKSVADFSVSDERASALDARCDRLFEIAIWLGDHAQRETVAH